MLNPQPLSIQHKSKTDVSPGNGHAPVNSGCLAIQMARSARWNDGSRSALRRAQQDERARVMVSLVVSHGRVRGRLTLTIVAALLGRAASEVRHAHLRGPFATARTHRTPWVGECPDSNTPIRVGHALPRCQASMLVAVLLVC